MNPAPVDPYDRAQQVDPYPRYRALRERDPVHHNEVRGFWALSRHADVLAALLDPATVSSARGSFLDDPGGDRVTRESRTVR